MKLLAVLIAVLSRVIVAMPVNDRDECKMLNMEQDTNYYGDDIWHNGEQSVGELTVEECKDLCLGTDDCLAFSYRQEYKLCWMKKSDSGKQSEAGYVSGKKECNAETTTAPVTTPTPAQYIRINSATCESRGISVISTEDECKAAVKYLGIDQKFCSGCSRDHTDKPSGCLFRTSDQRSFANTDANTQIPCGSTDHDCICRNSAETTTIPVTTGTTPVTAVPTASSTIIVPTTTTQSILKEEVSCGNHKADSCHECPEGIELNKELWCNGDCLWDEPNSDCIKKTPIHCEWNDWVNGTCSKPCGTGTRIDTRTKKVEENDCGTCTGQYSKIEQCNIEPCEPESVCEWKDWECTGCTQTCGGGFHTCTREPVDPECCDKYPDSCKSELREVQENCDNQECPVNCQWSVWGHDDCCPNAGECGEGVRNKTRTIEIPAQFGGEQCYGEYCVLEPCVKECPEPSTESPDQPKSSCEDSSGGAIYPHTGQEYTCSEPKYLPLCKVGTWFKDACKKTCNECPAVETTTPPVTAPTPATTIPTPEPATPTPEECKMLAVEQDTHYYGNDLWNDGKQATEGLTIEGCQELCKATDECIGFTYKIDITLCWMKTSDAGKKDDAGYVSGKKECNN